jgi:hypothetical protein
VDNLRTLGRLLMGAPPGPDVDWSAMVALARHNHVAPLLFLRLKQAGQELDTGEGELENRQTPVPMPVMEQLRVDYVASVLHGMLAERELAEVLEALAAADVPVLIVKGPALGAFYPHETLRPYGDLDLLVPKEQLDRAQEALHGLGYGGTPANDWIMERHPHLPHLVSDDKQLTVELHWRLDNPGATEGLSVEDLWARAVPWSVQGQPALRLDPVDAGLYLCSHALLRHRGNLGLRPLCDLTQVTRQWTQQQWESLAQRAKAYGLEHVVYLMLSLMEEVLGSNVPQAVKAAVRPPGPKRLPEDLVNLMVGLGQGPTDNVPTALVQVWAHGAQGPSLRRLLWHLFLPRKAMATVYNIPTDSPRIWLAYLWRPIDLLRRYGRAVWATLRRDPKARSAWAEKAWLEGWLWVDGGDEGSRDRHAAL